jgi:tryptophanyl-tRNA synthetase
MSNSLRNTINLFDPPERIRAKIAPMKTDTRRKRKTDPGVPDDCPVFTLHKAFVEEEKREALALGCRSADIGCLECKNVVIDRLIEILDPLQETKRQFDKDPQKIWDILQEGKRKAQKTAQKTMEEVRKAIGL